MSVPSRRPDDRLAPTAISEPEADAETEPTRPTTTASPRTLRDHLAAGGADRPQQGELAGALPDQHRERVDDDERADEQGDPGEDQQERREEAEPLSTEVSVSSVDGRPGHRLGGRGQRRGDRCAQCAWLDAGAAVTGSR